jgi:hypothetical protein
MTTSPPINPSREQLTLFAVDSPARTSQPLASKPASRKALGLVSFTNSCESFAWWDRDTSSWKTSQRSLLEGWTSFSENWPRQGLMLSGHVYRQVLWAPAISAIGGGLLPTPVAQTGQGGPKGLDGGAGNLESDRSPNLGTVIAREMLPTPRAGETSDMTSKPGSSYSLSAMARQGAFLPTPTRRDWKDGSQQACQNVEANGLLGREIHQAAGSIPTGEAMYLNPCFVEEMMGFPLGWTD